MPRTEESLRVAVLLTASGGFLDAFTWLAHGNVLANTQSANVVLLGVYTALGQWPEAFRHIPPIIAFVLGAFTAAFLRAYARDAGRRVSLLLEIALLFAVMALHEQLPSTGVTLLISFAAAVQTTRFVKVEGWAFSSVMTTGNLRHSTEAVFAGLFDRAQPHAFREAGIFATICVAFGMGATIGAFATSHLSGGAPLAVPVLLLGAALLICEIKERA
jgi:uncharacterized membrane protein YoaK (UPF0700 family)